jgi:hypothetical protein
MSISEPGGLPVAEHTPLTFAEFKEEMADIHQRVLRRCLRELTDLGMSEAGLTYVRELRGYPRTPYYMTIWVADPVLRRELGVGVCVHAVGVKLIDDLIDDDQPIGVRDQIFGVQLLSVGTTLLGSHRRPARVLSVLEADYRDIWRQEVREVNAPRPTDLESWIAAARIKAGVMLANYGAVACLAGGDDRDVPRARDFGEALGVLYMIGDDVIDHTEHGERDGNLTHLVATGRVAVADLHAEIDRWRDRAVTSVRGARTACDPVPFLDHFATKLRALTTPAQAAR